MRKKIALFIASGCYSGFAPISPGTCGSLACLLIWYFILPSDLSLPVSLSLATATTALAILSTKLVIESSSTELKDPQYIVIDEWAGLLIPLILTPKSNLIAILLAFTLFRLFDITKPGPVSWAEELPGAWGIVADDVIAGIFALIILLVVYSF